MFAWLLFGLGIILALFILVGGLSLARSFLGRSLIAVLGSLLAIPLAVAIVATLLKVYRNSCRRCRSFGTMSLKRKYQEGDNSGEILQCEYCGYSPGQPFGPVDSSS
jgi:NhaP-type Na+/H+ and K+/H+ antiporter